MCGFAGIVDFRSTESRLATLKEMTETIHSRGPDASDYFEDAHCSFGHKRLIVVDAEGGKQPFQLAPYRMVYNGELYNTEDVRQELLKAGHQFNSYSDTEVLIHAYAEWGAACVDHLNGIFAFAVWNESTSELFLARDRLGVKPLFYSLSQHRLLFASEPKALLTHPDVSPVVTNEGLASLFALGPGRFPGHDLFRDIQELRPGFRAFFHPQKGFMQQRYWQLPTNDHIDSAEDTVQRVRYLAEQAIRRQLVSDVPIGTFLSGGIDSSIITAIAAKENIQLSTFSVDYVDNEHYFQSSSFQPDSDHAYIEAMIEAYGLHHTNISLTSDQLFDGLQEAMVARDAPGMGDIDSSLLAFCRLVKPHATVVLSGECADELFAGYPWLQEEQSVPDFFWIRNQQQRFQFLHPDLQQKLPLEDVLSEVRSSLLYEVLKRGEPEHLANHKGASYLTMQHFMQNLLERKDRMSMRSGLEVRVPFADHELWEYVWNIPLSIKRMGGQEKGLLRAAFHDVLPDKVLKRKKNPYPKTFHPVYTSLVRERLSEVVARQGAITSLFQPAFFNELLDTSTKATVPWFGQLMQTPQLMAYLIQLEDWIQMYGVEFQIR
ncbi:asparagine synthase (glutamine-hydrolyzing) [Chryseomicrobium palamuruense]|uniref:asparagine synthase (glutamine-hydrolyzing) n=1 Tax=Chryseomicrobium palamuruense TaxID=682973 RepID=A0ABV8UUG9_9BACL